MAGSPGMEHSAAYEGSTVEPGPRLRWATPLGAGLALGVANSASNAFGSAYGPFTTTPGQGVRWLEYVSSWLGTPWAWALFTFGVGWFVRRLAASATLAAAALILAVVAYYVSDAALGLNEQLSVVEIQIWAQWAVLVAAAVLAMGLTIRAVRRRRSREHLG